VCVSLTQRHMKSFEDSWTYQSQVKRLKKISRQNSQAICSAPNYNVTSYNVANYSVALAITTASCPPLL
jgi:hypothetical protein